MSAEFGPDSGGRIKGLTIVKPVVYGNIARYFGKKREEDGHTHQWTVYIKPYKNEDFSGYVKKVHFKLHESYPNANRVVTAPPYQVTETGWGEFEIKIVVFFQDPNERPVTIYHILKLFQSESNILLGKKQVVSELYDELIFQDPSAMMQQLLTNTKQLVLGPYKHEIDFEEKKEKSLAACLSAKNKIRFEIADMKDRLKLAREAIAKFREEIAKLEQNQDREADDK